MLTSTKASNVSSPLLGMVPFLLSADIPNPTGEEMVEKIFTGPIQRQLKDALLYIKNYVLKEKIYKFNDKAEALRVFN